MPAPTQTLTLLTENQMTLDDAAKAFKVNIETVRRWVRKGFRENKLEVVRIGNKYHTSKEAMSRFVAACA